MESWRRPSIPQLPGHGPEPRLRDTATGAIRPAATGPDQDSATIYTCGITPYDATHIGHAATFTAWDLLIRAWLDAGRAVTYSRTSPTWTTPCWSGPNVTVRTGATWPTGRFSVSAVTWWPSG